MKFLIIIPAHNEEKYIISCLESIKNQSFIDFHCIVVNDGSTDFTGQIVEDFINKNDISSHFSVLHLSESWHEPGAKVVHTFNKGLNSYLSISQIDIICKFDADIIFPIQYLEEINRVYCENPFVGMISGLVYTEQNGEWNFENISNKNHIRGPIKSYRKSCFEAIGGLRPVLGWDNIDVMLAKMNGFQTLTLKSLWVKHLRPTAYKYKAQKYQKLGEYYYNLGLNIPLAMISSLKSSVKNRSFSAFFIMMRSFFHGSSRKHLSRKEIKYIRQARWREMRDKFFIGLWLHGFVVLLTLLIKF